MREEEKQYFEEPEFRESLRKYEDAIQEGSSVYMDADDLTDIAEYYMIHEQEEKANHAIALAVAMHPEATDPQIFLARQQMFHNNLEQAHALCEAIADQEDREVIFLRAELMIRDNAKEKAAEYLLDVYEKATSDRANLLYDSTCIFIDYECYDEALHFANKLQRDFPEYHKALYLLSEIHTTLGNFKEAIPLLNTILDRDPYDIEAWNILAEANRAEENFQEAIDNTEYVLAIEPENKKALITKAHCLIHLNNFDEAHDIYTTYLQQHPQDVSFLYLDGACLACVERFDEAVVNLRKASGMENNDSVERMHIYLQLAYVESKLHNVNNALQALSKAKEFTNEDLQIEYNLLIGEVLLENGQKDEAEDHFKLAIDESEDKRGTLLNIGITYGESKYYEEAITILNAILELFPGEEGRIAIPYLAYCYFNTNDVVNYLKYLRESVSVSRETTQFLFERHFPNIAPEEYYTYAFHDIYNRFPEDWE